MEKSKRKDLIESETTPATLDSNKEENNGKQTIPMRLSPKVANAIRKYKDDHNCHSDDAAADALFGDYIQKQAAVGDNKDAENLTNLFDEHMDQARSQFLSLVYLYRETKEKSASANDILKDTLSKDLITEREAREAAEKCNGQLIQEVKDLKEELNSSNTEKKRLTDAIDALSKREDATPLRQKLERISEELANTKNTLLKTENTLEVCKKELETVRQDNQLLSKEKDSLKKENADLKTERQQIKDELGDTKLKLNTAETELSAKNKAFTDLEETNKIIRSEKQQAEEKRDAYEQKSTKLLEDIGNIKSELATAREQVKAAWTEGREEGRREILKEIDVRNKNNKDK